VQWPLTNNQEAALLLLLLLLLVTVLTLVALLLPCTARARCCLGVQSTPAQASALPQLPAPQH
jgi:hypothetical protein